jgi:flagellar biogenesis protein FliO
MNTDTPPSFALQLGSTALALVLVLALAWVMLRALKRWQQKTGVGPGAHPVQVVHSVALGPRERLVTVRWRGYEYLLGVGVGAVQRIAQAPVDEAPARSGDGAASAVTPTPTSTATPTTSQTPTTAGPGPAAIEPRL